MPDTVDRDKMHHREKFIMKETGVCHREPDLGMEPEEIGGPGTVWWQEQNCLAPVLLVLWICIGERLVTSLKHELLEVCKQPS